MNSSENLKGKFKRLILRNRLSHAYLFFGMESNDARIEFARALANFLERKSFEIGGSPLLEYLEIGPDENEELSRRYIRIYEQLTGKTFEKTAESILERNDKNLVSYHA